MSGVIGGICSLSRSHGKAGSRSILVLRKKMIGSKEAVPEWKIKRQRKRGYAKEEQNRDGSGKANKDKDKKI